MFYTVYMQLTGLAVLAIGIWMFVDAEIVKLVNFIASDESKLFRSAAIFLMALGCFVILVSALGFAGTVTESTTMLGIVSSSV